MTAKAIQGSYYAVIFGYDRIQSKELQQLFDKLCYLKPMNKNGMSGRCEYETSQMEEFLSQTFGFENIRDEYIVDGVRNFKMGTYPHMMFRDTKIQFPYRHANVFEMTADEVTCWQRSYRVYADKNIKGMSSDFIRDAVHGLSRNGEEAFRMKFVVRISTCPILMEFDGIPISRTLDKTWPNNIKLVSVTGIDFAGRIHDVGDIRYYIPNWREVFDTDPKSGRLIVYNGRDFRPKRNGQLAQLDEDRVFDSLVRMARLRLRACEEEKVQVVVETGIGLGVFSGMHIGIDAKVRRLSARAIRKVLVHDGPLYKNICAIVFALPIFSRAGSSRSSSEIMDDFVDEFTKSAYNGPIPVMVADQDMHRLTVAIANRGFIVSELNPADSHGVFGEYWQNRGPAVEEKLALTTVGLLVQHHLINPNIRNPANYHLVDLDGTSILDWSSTIARDDEKIRR